MNILERIIANKREEVAIKKEVVTRRTLEHSDLFERPTVSLASELRNSPMGIIAEFKRRSPSKAVIDQSARVWEVAHGYEKAGVSGMSVLTDGTFFGGSLDDLLMARGTVSMPLLRKEFIIDPYQLVEAKAYGADVILLIGAVLSRQEIEMLSQTAQGLGLEVLLEVHNEHELEKALMPSLDMIGVNNRNLKTFEVSLNTSKSLADKIPDDFVKVSESGISSPEAVSRLRDFGYKGFLVGEHFMKAEDTASCAKEFVQNISES